MYIDVSTDALAQILIKHFLLGADLTDMVGTATVAGGRNGHLEQLAALYSMTWPFFQDLWACIVRESTQTFFSVAELVVLSNTLSKTALLDVQMA